MPKKKKLSLGFIISQETFLICFVTTIDLNFAGLDFQASITNQA